MAQLDNTLKEEFEALCESLSKEKIETNRADRRILNKMQLIKKAIELVLDGGQSNNKITALNYSLICFNERVNRLLRKTPEKEQEKNADVEYVMKNFRGVSARKLMLYLIEHLDEPKTIEEISNATGLTIRQMYDIKKHIENKLKGKGCPFTLDILRLKQGIYKLVRKRELNKKQAKYTKQDIEDAKTWTAINFNSDMRPRLMMILAENLGKFVSLGKISKRIPEIPRDYLSTYICRLAENLIKNKRLYIIERGHGRYRLVKNENPAGKELPAFRKWAKETTQNDPIYKAVMKYLGKYSLEKQIKIADLQNCVIGANPSENHADISEKITNFIIKLCGKSSSGELRAIVEKGYISVYLSSKIQEREAAHQTASTPPSPQIHISLFRRCEIEVNWDL